MHGETFSRIADRYRPGVLAELHQALDSRGGPPYGLMRYQMGWEDAKGTLMDYGGGKLLRPALCLLCCEALGGDARSALPAAAALELVHNFSLIHDDIEDKSKFRHGRPALWRVAGIDLAINAGDGMFALANATLMRLAEAGQPPERVVRAVRMLTDATLRLCEGQHLDLEFERERGVSIEQYVEMIEGKSAVLLAAACGLGALLAGADDKEVDGLYEFGRRLGLGFQIRDDALGIWGNTAVTGKPSGDDLRAGKNSYPIVVALDRADRAQRAQLEALLAEKNPADGDVAAGARLVEQLGAREECDRAAAEHVERAVTLLGDLPLLEKRRAELAQIARFAGARDA